ncbi:hypothetical protein M409DRAFT_49828 [Zasmidium cellare ATCC 36951]|uniref:Uncharacterized protein n=1 Tax=Zasmidium cellare ATCC 36951 TaxID=1080233 RepID=A0A6A6CXW9_ZASCE|nr:uncharacterized protein M409DRAFT_49828 [Zasmidium cellare ATCC 36951]KAF2172077.1 hypothetical protein M409DRAFT_49828 [Zasmidium cellare ATCC 36951]
MSTNTLIRQCEALAQKLYNQCRDTSSPYKTLTSGLRRLRNVLGDIDEILNDTDDPRSSDTKLQPCLVQSKSILEKLDMALVTYKCMRQVDVDNEAVAGLKASIEDVTQELASAHEKLTRTGEMSMSACSCVLVRKTSQGSKTSSSWSLINRDTPSDANSLESQSFPVASVDFLRPSDEKEVCRTNCSRLQPSASDTSLGGKSTTASWRSISLDPLSQPIADASRIIMSSDSPIESKPTGDLIESTLSAAGDQVNQLHKEEAPLSDEAQLWQRVDAIMNGTPKGKNQRTPGIPNSEPFDSPRRHSGSSMGADAAAFPGSLPDVSTEDIGAGRHTTECDNTTLVHSPAQDAHVPSISSHLSATINPSQFAARLPPSPRTRRREMYEIMCCTEGQALSTPTIVLPDSPGTESCEDLYSATPPKKARLAGTEDASLYPDPLQLKKKLVGLDFDTRSFNPTLESRSSRHHSAIPNRCRRNSTGVLAELEGEPVHPPTRSSSCSSLPRYESVVARSRPLGRTATQARMPPGRHLIAGRRVSAAPRRCECALRMPEVIARAGTTCTCHYPVEKTPAATKLPSTPTFKCRQSADDALQITKISRPRRRVQYAIRISNRTWYERDQEDTHAAILDQERMRHIVHYWNESSWDIAEQYLTAHLDEINTGSHGPSFRRTQHLLGVCASFRGEWDEAINRFIKVLRKPIRRVSDLDDGDCAAAYCLSSAERMAVQLGVSKSEFKRHWSEEALLTIEKGAGPSILTNDVIAMETARSCLENGSQEKRDQETRDFAELVRARHLHAFLLKDNDKLGVRPELNERMAMKIDADCLDPDSPWPMPYDPLFCMPHVQRGRLLAYECDMLNVFETNPEAKLPRPLSLKLDCFTCSDLTWLITTIRTCLTTYEIDHSEVVNVQGTWFCCRYSFMQHKIATTHYFSIALFKHPFRGSYGAEICADEGMGSARIVESAGNYKNGVHCQEPKRIKRLIRHYLDEAAKRAHSKERRASGQSRPVGRLPSQYDTT